ncbi:hypothetical protein ETD86_29945 [Nonomuraea turkmeniaca]|uniref:Uncharacterized protein n=1 Tax=Nonomuraea turkmeniaca TaxID=103838 RepID=A0A5S4FUD7_9ACTN|nr:hypothetical protein [Nonomuraea turkmeniaca]TMR13790.1 hypothetical protein ETD86_29945 [Nonomuraea turkmeniaca]
MLNTPLFDRFIRVYLGVAATLLPLMWAAHIWPKNVLALMTSMVAGWSLGLAFVIVQSTWRKSGAGTPQTLRGDAQLRGNTITITWNNVLSTMNADDADRLAEHLRNLAADARKARAA